MFYAIGTVSTHDITRVILSDNRKITERKIVSKLQKLVNPCEN